MGHERVIRAIEAVRTGSLVVVADDAERENEGDLLGAAERIDAEKLSFIVRHTSGLVCAPLSAERAHELALPQMHSDNEESQRTAFTVSVDYRYGISTGISARDRSKTLRALADRDTRFGDFVRPGHVFPLRARRHGVLERRGHTEAAVDLARLAGLAQVGVLCELVRDDGEMMRGRELERFAEQHALPFLTIEELAAHRWRNERLVEAIAEARLPTRHGAFRARVYRSLLDGVEHVALLRGEIAGREDVLVRVHSECVTGDIFGSLRCDCGDQLEAALARVASEGRGVIVYLRGHEGRGIGLARKLEAYSQRDRGRDTVEANLELGLPADAHNYDVAAQILGDLGLTTLRLMSNSPAKFSELAGYHLRIVECVPLAVAQRPENVGCLHTKQQKLEHRLGLSQLA